MAIGEFRGDRSPEKARGGSRHRCQCQGRSWDASHHLGDKVMSPQTDLTLKQSILEIIMIVTDCARTPLFLQVVMFRMHSSLDTSARIERKYCALHVWAAGLRPPQVCAPRGVPMLYTKLPPLCSNINTSALNLRMKEWTCRRSGLPARQRGGDRIFRVRWNEGPSPCMQLLSRKLHSSLVGPGC